MSPLSVCDTSISIRNNLYSLNDLHKAAGSEAKHQPARFLRNDQAQDLISELDKYPDLGISHEVIRGAGGGTKELRDVFDVNTWKDISTEHYTQAKALVKSMVLEGELMPRQHNMPLNPMPQPPRRQEILVAEDDWRLIVDAIHILSTSIEAAWAMQGGRSANNWNNPNPRSVHMQLPYDVATRISRVTGKVYGYTFAAMGVSK